MNHRVGSYTLLQELARGGVGAVYRAHDPAGRQVAVKLLLAGRDATPLQRQRFQREAQALARLQHPNIVRVHTAGEERGVPYLVMDLVEGASLQDRLDRGGPLPVRQAAEVMRSVAGALQAAHAQQLLHRDVKPDNIILTPEGEPLLTDFGLAKDLQAQTRATVSGMFMGTPGFWPPEQAAGEVSRLAPASDVYAAGATLYCLLTGELPFRAQTLPELLVQTAGVIPDPPSTLRPDCPRSLDAICLRCLEKDPGDRYSTAGELADELEAFLEGRPVTARLPAERLPTGPIPLLVALALVLLTALIGAVVWTGARATPDAAARPTSVTEEDPAAGSAERPPHDSARAWKRTAFDPLRLPPQGGVWESWACAPVNGALRIRAKVDSNPGLGLPLDYSKGPFEVSVEVTVHYLEGDQYVTFSLAPYAGGGFSVFLNPGERSGTPVDRLEVRLSGSGKATTAHIPWRGSPLELRLRARFQTPSLRLTVEDRKTHRALCALTLEPDAHLLRPGVYVLMAGLNGTSKPKLGGNFSCADVHRLEVRAPTAGLRLSSTNKLLNHDYFGAGAHLSAGRTRQAQERLAAAAPDMNDAGLLWSTAWLRALILARLGELEEAADRLRSLSIQHSQWFGDKWRTSLGVLQPSERRALGKAFQPSWLPRNLNPRTRLATIARESVLPLSLAERLAQDQAMALLAARVEELGPVPDLAWGSVLLRIGNLHEALSVLEPLERAKPGSTHGLGGLCAFRLRRFRLAIELWEKTPPPAPRERRLEFSSHLARARELVGK